MCIFTNIVELELELGFDIKNCDCKAIADDDVNTNTLKQCVTDECKAQCLLKLEACENNNCSRICDWDGDNPPVFNMPSSWDCPQP